MERFKREEDRAILDTYIKYGFHLTKEALEEASKVTGRTVDSIRNRMSRYLFPLYPATLNKNFHIRIFLIENLAKSINSSNPDAYHNVFEKASKLFMMDLKKLITDFEESNNEIWGKRFISTRQGKCPDTFAELILNFTAKEDEKLNLFSDIVAEVQEELEKVKKTEERPSWFKRLVNWIKNLFK